MNHPASRWRAAAVAAASLFPLSGGRAEAGASEPTIADLLQRAGSEATIGGFKASARSPGPTTPEALGEITARYHVLNVDNAAFEGGAAGGQDRNDEKAFLTPRGHGILNGART